MSVGSQGPQGPARSFGEAAEGWQRVSPILILPLAGPVSSGKGPRPSVSVSILVADTWWVVGRTQWDRVG